MKILISAILVFSTYIFANEWFDINMDKKIYYDANRDNNDILDKMSEDLTLFKTSKADDILIDKYKNGTLKLSKEELELQERRFVKIDTNSTTTNQDTNKSGFFSSMFSNIGFSSTNKEIKNTKQEVKNEK
jgi:hypothetical protein